MTTRNLLLSVTALLVLATLTDHVTGAAAGAAEPALIVTPAYALAEFDLTSSAITPSEADLRQVKNELRFEQRKEMVVTMAREFRAALDDVKVIAD